jgi:hypothetical protein
MDIHLNLDTSVVCCVLVVLAVWIWSRRRAG